MKDLLTSICLMMLAVAVFVGARTFAETENGIADNPALYPQGLSVIMAGLGTTMFIKSIKSKELKKFPVPSIQLVVKTLLFFTILIGYALLMGIFGFITSTVISIFLFVHLMDGTTKAAIISSVAIAVIVYLVFEIVLNVPLPSNIFWS